MKNKTLNIARRATLAKPRKPSKDWPLFAHATGQWAKKIAGKIRYFGTWDDPAAALTKYLKEKDYYLAGASPSEEGVTLGRLCNLFLGSKQMLVESGELSARTFNDYKMVCKSVLSIIGNGRLIETLTPQDFERLRSAFAKKHGLVSLSNDITRARVLFKYAYDSDLVDRPIKYGQNFKRPSKTALRKHRETCGEKMFTAMQLGRKDVHGHATACARCCGSYAAKSHDSVGCELRVWEQRLCPSHIQAH